MGRKRMDGTVTKTLDTIGRNVLEIAQLLMGISHRGIPVSTVPTTPDLVRYATREGVGVDVSHVLIMSFHGTQQLQEVATLGGSYISLLDGTLPSQFGDRVDEYDQVVGETFTTASWDGHTLIRVFSSLTVAHHLVHPRDLSIKDLPAPSLVILDDSNALGVHHAQEWVRQLSPGTILLSRDNYPLLSSAEREDLHLPDHSTTEGVYRAQRRYEGSGLVLIHPETADVGILRKQ